MKNYLETNENEKNDDPQPMGCHESSSMKKVYGNKNFHQETRKISIKQPNITPKATKERRTNKTQS